MRTSKRLLSLLAFAVPLLAPGPAAAQPELLVSSGDAATIELDQTSPDGCIHTSGQVAIAHLWALDEAPQTVIVATGIRENRCAGTSSHFYGSGPVDAVVLGLVYARATGSVLAGNEQGDPPVRIAVDLAWLGYGPAIGNGGVVRDTNHIEVSYKGQRAATTHGGVTLDDAPVSLSGGRFLHDTSGWLQF